MRTDIMTKENHLQYGIMLKEIEKKLFELASLYKTKQESHNSVEEKAIKTLEKLSNHMIVIEARDFDSDSY